MYLFVLFFSFQFVCLGFFACWYLHVNRKCKTSRGVNRGGDGRNANGGSIKYERTYSKIGLEGKGWSSGVPLINISKIFSSKGRGGSRIFI